MAECIHDATILLWWNFIVVKRHYFFLITKYCVQYVRGTCMYIYTHTHTHTHIIFIYIYHNVTRRTCLRSARLFHPLQREIIVARVFSGDQERDVENDTVHTVPQNCVLRSFSWAVAAVACYVYRGDRSCHSFWFLEKNRCLILKYYTHYYICLHLLDIKKKYYSWNR